MSTFEYTLRCLSEAATGCLFSIPTSNGPSIEICKLEVCRLVSGQNIGFIPPSIYIHQANDDQIYSPYHSIDSIKSQASISIEEYKNADEIKASKTIFCCYDINQNSNKLFSS
jgi:hypothetical protein